MLITIKRLSIEKQSASKRMKLMIKIHMLKMRLMKKSGMLYCESNKNHQFVYVVIVWNSARDFKFARVKRRIAEFDKAARQMSDQIRYMEYESIQIPKWEDVFQNNLKEKIKVSA